MERVVVVLAIEMTLFDIRQIEMLFHESPFNLFLLCLFSTLPRMGCRFICAIPSPSHCELLSTVLFSVFTRPSAYSVFLCHTDFFSCLVFLVCCGNAAGIRVIHEMDYGVRGIWRCPARVFDSQKLIRMMTMLACVCANQGAVKYRYFTAPWCERVSVWYLLLGCRGCAFVAYHMIVV